MSAAPWRRAGPALALGVCFAGFALCCGESFFGLANLRLMLLQSAVVGAAACGATLIIVSGGIDLSVGSNVALGTVAGALCLRAGASPALAALAALGSGALCGLAIGGLVVGSFAPLAAGVCVALGARGVLGLGLASSAALGLALAAAIEIAQRRARLRLPLSPFIATLGLWGALRGLAKGLGDNQPVYPRTPPGTGWIGALMQPAPEGVLRALPPAVWILAATVGLGIYLLRATIFGRHVYAIGSSEPTARLCGVPVERTKLLVYAFAGLCAGIAALLQLSFLSMGDPTTAAGLELRAIAAAVIGGASLSGGEGSVGGALVGALIMTVVDAGCTQLGLDNWVQEIATGAIVVAAVALDRSRQRA